MKKRSAEILVLLFLVIFSIPLIASIFSDSSMIPTSSKKGTNTFYNITFDNTNNPSEIIFTELNITFQKKNNAKGIGILVYTPNSNGASTLGTFTQTDYILGIYKYTVLSWKNPNLITDGAIKYFWFNVTGETPGKYGINITTLDSSSNIKSINLSIEITPHSIIFTSPTPETGSAINQNYISANISISEDVEIGQVIVNLYNSTKLVGSKTSESSPFFLNFTGLQPGTYYLNATLFNSAGNKINTEETRKIILSFSTQIITTTGCSPLWNCTKWSDCIEGKQIRSCIDTNACGNNSAKPIENQECYACVPNWNCTNWLPETCSETKTQARNCTDINNCESLEGKPAEIKNCEFKEDAGKYLIPAIIIIIILIVVTFIIIIELWKKPYLRNIKQQRKTRAASQPR